MAITMSELVELLSDANLKFRAFSDDSGALLQFPSCAVQVTITEEGEGLLACAHSVFNVKEVPHRDAALEWIANHNYRIKVGRWGFDKSDGDVTIDYFLPIEDGSLTSKQLARVIRTIASEARREIPTLARIAYTGKRSDDDDDDDDDVDLDSSSSPDFSALLRSLEERMDEVSPRLTFGPDDIPSEPVSEENWMQLVLRALTAGADARAMGSGDCDPATIRDWMQRLNALRDLSSPASETPWTTVALREEHGLTDDEELMLLWFAARHVGSDTRILRSEARRLCGSEDVETPPALRALLDRGLVKPTDDDGIEPFCLAPTVVERLGDLLVRPSEGS